MTIVSRVEEHLWLPQHTPVVAAHRQNVYYWSGLGHQKSCSLSIKYEKQIN